MAATLGNEETLNQQEYLVSGDSSYYAVLQSDGNFVVYRGDNFVPSNALWASNSNGKGTAPFHVIMQDDGNLVLYDFNEKPLWASNTAHKGTAPFTLIMQEDGNLVIYDAHDTPTWATNTDQNKAVQPVPAKIPRDPASGTNWTKHFHDAKRSWEDFNVESVEEFQKIHAYRESHLKDGVITHSFKLPNGNQVVCIKMDTQGMGQSGATRKLATPPAEKPPKRQVHQHHCQGHHFHQNQAQAQSNSGYQKCRELDGSMDEDGNIRYCPAGSIPRLVPSMQNLCRHRRLSDIVQKSLPQVKTTLVGQGTKYYAFAALSGVAKNAGGTTNFTVWKPSAYFTTSQIWVAASSPTTQTVEAGWQVYNGLYGDDEPHLFIYYTADNYGPLSGYNLAGGTFVQTDNSVMPGQTLSYSTYDDGAKQVAIQIAFKFAPGPDKSQVIWFYYGGKPVGYYPLSVFGSSGLAQGATLFYMGGESNSTGDPSFPDQMGSGHFASEGANKAASCTNIQYYSWPNGDTTTGTLNPTQHDPSRWTISQPASGSTGGSFFYGGPGTTAP